MPSKIAYIVSRFPHLPETFILCEMIHLEKLGWQAGDTAELTFENVAVPVANRLGEEGSGFYNAMANLEWERLIMALGKVYGAQLAFDKTKIYVLQREAFGRPIGKFQVNRHKMVDMAMEIEAARQLNYHALRKLVNGEPCAAEVSMAKVFASRDLGSAITSPPMLASDGNLYVGSFASSLEAFNPANGNNESVEKTIDWVWGTPGQVGDNLYFGDLSGNFYSYNLETGKYNWNPITLKPDNWAPNSSDAPDESKLTAITASPIAVNDMILVATESGAIYQVDMDGNQELWGGQQQQPGGKIYTTPVLAGDLVLVSPMTSDAFLYAYDLNGDQKWAFKPAN